MLPTEEHELRLRQHAEAHLPEAQDVLSRNAITDEEGTLAASKHARSVRITRKRGKRLQRHFAQRTGSIPLDSLRQMRIVQMPPEATVKHDLLDIMLREIVLRVLVHAAQKHPQPRFL